MIVDRTCETCWHLHTNPGWSGGCNCNYCTDGLVPYIALTKQGEWDNDPMERTARTIYEKDPIYKPPYWEDCTPNMKVWYRAMARSILDTLAEASAFGGGR